MADDTLILSFDTATSCCSIAITVGGLTGGRVVGSLALDSGVTHSRRLLSSVDWLLEKSSLSLEDLQAICVGLGPGSFTGLRIGMSTAKGLAHGSGKPLVGISSLDTIGKSLSSDRLICVLLDARKNEVYGCFYRQDRSGVVMSCSATVVTSAEQLARQIDEPVLMAGDGVAAYRPKLKEILGDNMIEAPALFRYPSAAMAGLIAEQDFEQGNLLDIASAAPLYVRASDAELSLKAPGRKDVQK